MTIRTRIDPIDRDIALILSEDLSPEAQSAALAAFAAEALSDAEQQNAAVLGRVPRHDTYVDRVETKDLARVRPDGVISFEFELFDEALTWIAEQLIGNAPYKTGQFAASFALFVDGDEVDIGQPPPLLENEAVFLNTTPYSRKIERGQSPQAPDGIFESIAILANRRFHNVADIRFRFRALSAGSQGAWAKTRSARVLAERIRAGNRSKHTEWLERTPAIVVTPYA